MRSNLGIGAVVVLVLIVGVWIYLDSNSDRLAGNLTIETDAPRCNDEALCEELRQLLIADAHSDTLLHRVPSQASNAGHTDLSRMIEGGVNLQIFAMASFVPVLDVKDGAVCGDRSKGDRLTKLFVVKEPLRPAAWVSPIARVDRMVARFEGALVTARETSMPLQKIETSEELGELRQSIDDGTRQHGAILAIEGAYWASSDKSALEEQLDKLHWAGVRMIGLTHRSSNQLAGSNEDCFDRHGLTELGNFAVAEIWRRGIVLDLAHASSATINDVAELAVNGKGGPVIVSHTGIKSACEHDRNLSDEDVLNIARAGGVVALGFWSTVNCFEESSTAQQARAAIARSFAIAYRILAAPEFSAEMGPDYVASEHLALGSDFDGATLVPADASATPWYLEGIARHEGSDGPVFNKSDIENIAGESLFRLLENALSAG